MFWLQSNDYPKQPTTSDIDPFIYTKCILATSLLWGKSRTILDSLFSGCEDFVVQEWESHDSWQGGVKYD